MQSTKTHWPSILILAILALGILFFFVSTLVTGTISIVGFFDSTLDSAGNMIISFASGLQTIFLLVSGWFILQKTMGKEQAEISVRFPFAPWQIIFIPFIVIFCITMGAAVSLSGIKWLGWLLLPPLTLTAVVLPILLILGIGTNGLEFGPSWKTWSVLGLGMTIGPLVMVGLEVIVLIFFAVIGVIAVSTQPDLVNELGELAKLLNQGVSDEKSFELLVPYLTQPAVIASIFVFLSVMVPLIEELFKPLAVWLMGFRLESPANGFTLGMLSGGAFALIESLNVSGNGSGSWAVIIAVRAGTSLLHMTTSGLMGYAIVALVRQKKFGRFIGTYLATTVLHGIWNACAAGSAISTLGGFIGKPEWIWNLPAAVCGVMLLMLGIFIVLIAANRKVRAELESSPKPFTDEAGVK